MATEPKATAIIQYAQPALHSPKSALLGLGLCPGTGTALAASGLQSLFSTESCLLAGSPVDTTSLWPDPGDPEAQPHTQVPPVQAACDPHWM